MTQGVARLWLVLGLRTCTTMLDVRLIAAERAAVLAAALLWAVSVPLR